MIEAERCWIAGDLDGALHHAKALLARAPDADAFLILARIADERHAYGDAIALAVEAANLAPRDMRCVAQLAYAALRVGDLDLARRAARDAVQLEHPNAEALDLVGVVHHGLNDYAASAVALRRACATCPDDPRLLANLAAVLTLCGDIDGARGISRDILRIEPLSTRALATLSEIREASGQDNNIAAIRTAIGKSASPPERLVLHHALAREQEALGDIGASFATLDAGKRQMRAALPRPLHDDASMFRALGRVPGGTARGGRGGGQTIFIMGMPRSGTTVVERILSNCDAVTSLGESQAMPMLLRRATGSMQSHVADGMALADQWSRIPFDQIGTEYLSLSRKLAPGAPYHVDKLPMNFLLVDAIVAALPEARLLWVHRAPLDTVAGNYRQMFEYHSGTYDYTLSLEATAAFVAQAGKLRRRSITRYPRSVHAIDYDDLIDRPGHTARAIFDFCGLPWNDDVTAIERNDTPAGSASAVQVRQPIHDRHRARASAYRPYLQGIAAILADA